MYAKEDEMTTELGLGSKTAASSDDRNGGDDTRVGIFNG